MKRVSWIPFASLAVSLLALGALPSAARADDLPPTAQFFEEFDTNADGRVTKEEFRGSGEIFKLLDKNGDGTITPDDLGLPADYRPAPKKAQPAPESGPEPVAPGEARRGRQGGQLKARLKAMDADGDGKISKEEFKGPQGAFERFDRNRDGFLDAQDRLGDKRPGDGARGRGPGGGAPAGGDAKASAEELQARAAELFGRLDKNQDGKLEGDEVPNPRLLEAADKDGDGAVSEKEFVKAHVAFARRGGRGGDGAGRRGQPRLTAAMLKRWDGDADGKVSAEEFPGREEMFKRLDADADGFLSEADVEALRAKRQQARPEKPKGPAEAPKPPVTPEAKPFRALDRDGDGRLHRGEFPGSDEDWKRLDKNQDGWITPDEMP